MEKLKRKLETFYEDRNKKLASTEQWDANAVAECFVDIAKYVLLNGYFLVNETYIIDIGAIELYYHEEDKIGQDGKVAKRGQIKDHIMYHTNEHPSKSEVFKLNNGYPYFEIGSFNLHQSGVDVTFENEEEKYRASFLIRSYRVFNKNEENKVYDLSCPFDKCSTHIYDDMFYGGIPFDTMNKTTIEWIELDSYKKEDIERWPRTNVAEYRLNDKNKYEKDDFAYNSTNMIAKKDYDAAIKEANENKSHPKYFKYGTDKYYKQDMRLWQFKRKDIKEH